MQVDPQRWEIQRVSREEFLKDWGNLLGNKVHWRDVGAEVGFPGISGLQEWLPGVWKLSGRKMHSEGTRVEVFRDLGSKTEVVLEMTESGFVKRTWEFQM